MMNRTRALCRVAFLSFLLVILPACGGSEKLPFGLKSELVAGADHATTMAFAPDGRLFFGEQFTGAIRIVSADGVIQQEPFAQLDVATYINLDWGLTGIAIDPDFADNHFVYAFFTEPVSEGVPGSGTAPSPTTTPLGPTGRPKIVRFTDESGRGVDETVISDDFPVTPTAHPGFNGNGHIRFGPDGFLYASVGDYDLDPKKEPKLAQDPSSPVGKLLRMDKSDGDAAPGNPFATDPEADPRVFAYGFREPFDFVFHPKSDQIYGTDNTTGTCEELNIIEAGKNYGWPDVGEFPYADCSAGDQVEAIHHFARTNLQPSDHLSFVEVAGLAFTPASRYALLGDSLFVCESYFSVEEGRNPGILRRLVLGGPDFDQVSSDDVIVKDCKEGLAVSPDGTLYYSNNKEIRRLVPEPAG